MLQTLMKLWGMRGCRRWGHDRGAIADAARAEDLTLASAPLTCGFTRNFLIFTPSTDISS